jgi:cytochrome d ubiquinol oxidase subunit I
MAIATLALFRGRLFAARWLLWPILLLMPFPYVANEAGWIVSEVGRQPWIVYGIMKTAEGTSATVSQGETIFTLIGFLGMYFMLGLLFVYLVLREIASGPSNHATPVAAAAP